MIPSKRLESPGSKVSRLSIYVPVAAYIREWASECPRRVNISKAQDMHGNDAPGDRIKDE